MHKKLFKKNPAKALKSTIPKMEDVCDLTEMKIGDDGLKELMSTIIDNSKRFHTIELIGNHISDLGVDYLIEIVKSCPKIHTIKLEFNHVSSYGAEKLSHALKHNTTVRNLNLYNNKIGDTGAEHLASLLANNTTLQYLGLFGCDIHDKGANSLAEVLFFGNNRTIRKIVLSNNPIEDDDILESIEVSLKRNLGENVSEEDYPVLFVERLNKKHARVSKRMTMGTGGSGGMNAALSAMLANGGGGGGDFSSMMAVETTENNRFSSSNYSPTSGNNLSVDTTVTSGTSAATTPAASAQENNNNNSGASSSALTPRSPQVEDISENPVKRMMEKSGFKTSTIAPPQANPVMMMSQSQSSSSSSSSSSSQGNSKQHPFGHRVFGVPLEFILRRESEPGPYPVIVENILSYLERNCLKVEGLLRVPGQTKDMENLRREIDQGKSNIDFGHVELVDNAGGKAHTICGLIKSFTRELPEPLLTYDYFDQFIGAVKDPNSEKQVQTIGKLISMIPVVYRVCLARIIQFFTRVIASPETKMSAASISTCFGMNLMRMRPEEEDAQKLVQNTRFINKVCELLITHAETFFPEKVLLNAPIDNQGSEADKKRISALQFENGALKRKVEQLQQEKAKMEEEWQAEVASLKEEIAKLKKQISGGAQ